MSIDRPNLADAFTTTRRTPVDRAATLTGLLPATRPRPAPAPPAATPDRDLEPTPADIVEPAAVITIPAARPATARKTPRPVSSPTAPVSESAYTVTNVAVYLEPELLEQTKLIRRTTGCTYDDLVVQAFAAVDDEALRAHFRTPTPDAAPTGMPARQRRPRGTAGIQIQLRLSGTQTTWLTDQQQRLGAPSRSALVAAVLRLHLLD